MGFSILRKRRPAYILGRRATKRAVSGFTVAVTIVLTGVLLLHFTGAPVRAAGGQQRIAYYGSWDIYGDDYTLRKVHDTGAASRLTTLVYSFENISPTTLRCFQDVHAVDTNESNPNAGDGGADAWADYQYPFPADRSVDGVADSDTQPLRGNFNQLKKLKQKHPNLKIMLSIGGWTYSKYFSDAAKPANRAAFVNSCIDMYIRGNLPTSLAGDTTSGGAGVAAGIFDGIDIDWEFPGSSNGHVGNHTSPDDTANFTALLAEFRSQLNAQGAVDGKYYRLTAALPSGGNDIDKIQVSQIGQYLDYAGLMTYDMHGSWDNHTNFQAPLYPSVNDPDAATGFTVQQAVNHWQSAGMPADKIAVGLPFYWRGWSGVTAGANNGLYQPATGPSPAYPYSGVAGEAQYRELLLAGKLFNTKWDDTTKSPWVYDNGNFYTGDTPDSIAIKGQYIRSNGLAGAMIYALSNDDSAGTMLKSVVNGLNGNAAAPLPSPQTVAVMARTAASSMNTATNGEPINMIGGNYLLARDELRLPNKDNLLDFQLSYNSAAASEPSPVGWGWNHSYRIAAVTNDDGSVTVVNPDGRTDVYVSDGQGGFTAPAGMHDKLQLIGGVYKVTHQDRSVYNFNSKGLLASIVSPNGNAQTLAYDTNGQLSTITDSVNRHLTLAYDAFGHLQSVTDPIGRTVQYTYSSLGDLLEVKNQANEVTKYAYDSAHRITKVTDPRGHDVVINEYDANGRVTKQTDGRGNFLTLSYISGQTTYTDARGAQTLYTYDSQLRVTSVQDALGHTTSTTYDANGNVYQTTDQLGHVTTRAYDSRGNLTQLTNPAGGVQTFTYDTNDNLLTATDQLGHVTTYTYDANGNVLTRKDATNKTTTFAYNAAGQLVSVTDPLNNLTGYVYDASGNRVTATDPSSRNTYYSYDGIGRLTAVENHDHDEANYVLDPMDRLTTYTNPAGDNTTMQYDADGNRTVLTDANGHAMHYQYDAGNNLTQATNALGKATVYEYDANGNRTKTTDAKNHQTIYTYDNLGRQTQTTDPLGNISKVEYDAAGNVTKRIDASNRATVYAYDNLNRLTTVTYPNSTTASYTYDAVGNMLTATNSSGTTTNTYDANNRLLTTTDPHGAVTTYAYNALGSLSSVTYPDGKVVSYTYTPSNQLSTVTDWNNATTSYLYDNNARLATKIYPNTFKAYYEYDANGNLDHLQYKKGSSVYTDYYYTRDAVGNITEDEEDKVSTGQNFWTGYTYDAADQLLQADAPSDTYNYTYDDVGNMLTSEADTVVSNYTYNNANRLTAKTNTTRSFTYDPQGNQITDTGKTLGYNYDNQLTSYVNGGLTTNYIYDATGNRIDKTQTGTGAANYRYVNTGNNTVLTAKNLTANSTNYYVYGLDLISQGGAASSSRQYYLTDGLGNIRYVTNNTGSNVTSYTYDPYGNRTAGNASTSNYTYQAEQRDAESGMMFLRARYYDPTIGRFTSQDPVSGTAANPASQNGYNYTNNNPINLSDPTGQFAVGDWLYNAVGLNDYRNAVASQCPNWGSIAKSGGIVAVNFSILIPGEGEAMLAVRGASGLAKVAKVEEATYSVYHGVDPITNEIKYVGITGRDPAIRWAEHAASGTERANLRYDVVKDGLTKLEARNEEQNFIDQLGLQKNGGQLLNKINSIRR